MIRLVQWNSESVQIPYEIINDSLWAKLTCFPYNNIYIICYHYTDKNRTRRIQFTQDHQNRTIEDCKNVAWSVESWFLLGHSDVGSEFGVKNMKAWIIVPCLNGSGRWWWCNGGGDVFLAHLVPIEHCLNTTVYLSIVSDHVHPFMTTVYHLLMYFQQDNAPCHKAQIISDWFLEHDNEFTFLFPWYMYKIPWYVK